MLQPPYFCPFVIYKSGATLLHSARIQPQGAEMGQEAQASVSGANVGKRW